MGKIKNSGKGELRTYPFQIDYLTLPENSDKFIKKIDSWFLLEYFRKEALRRSKIVHDLYKKEEGIDGGELKYKYGVHWHEMVNGKSWDYLQSLYLLYFERPCIFNMAAWLEDGSEDDRLRFGNDVLKWERNQLLIQIDISFPTNHIIDKLRPFLSNRRKEILNNPMLYKDPYDLEQKKKFKDLPFTFPYHPTIEPPITDFKAWLTYLKCYDLRECEGLSFGKIAEQFYGDIKKYKNARSAYIRVKRLIECAEMQIWPPPKMP